MPRPEKDLFDPASFDTFMPCVLHVVGICRMPLLRLFRSFTFVFDSRRRRTGLNVTCAIAGQWAETEFPSDT